ncbi:ABC transporter substrate-binding protein [Motiliproteus sp. MSK22-1]|uniref:ABC transporter substrate-binding protein n=1 Tax=Motiliproteus sp. MSK22-1 TaxID=1897630 RepID=UPI0009766758|nr:ABC transporter substrate-binding protein [Motiliproteus sp. MSK22-1]OMH25740.1 ABC transporter substrate-binding protein [Motiliproteus sp. MSK22-1]
MKLKALSQVASLAVFSSLSISQVQAATITISCGAVGAEFELCQEGTKAWSKKSGHEVQLVSTPNSSTERLSLYQQILSAGAKDIDVFQIDVVWPGMLQNHLLDLKPYTNGNEEQHFPSLIKNNTVEGRLVAMPWFTDAGVLYYRKDLLEKYNQEIPITWSQLTEVATRIQASERAAGQEKMWGFVWQGRAYEGLTCDALEWIYSHNGGTIISATGKIDIYNEQSVQALNTARDWVGSISPKGVLNYAEEEARGVFQGGNAVFMRNWPYAWSLAQADNSLIKDKVGVTALPKGSSDGNHAGTLGGWQLAVSKYSAHADLAADLVMYLTSYTEQKRRAIKGSYNPTIDALYKDEEVLAKAPFFGDLYSSFVNGVPRPSTVTGKHYSRVSSAFFNATHNVLSGKASAKKALKKLEKKLKRIGKGAWTL